MESKIGLVWFSVASLVVIWDSLFVLLRPRSMPGGDLHHFWKPYELYIWVDKRYGDMVDTFGYAQSWINLIEVVFNLATFTLLLKKNHGALLCGFFVSTATLWKTLIYMVQYFDFCKGGHLTTHLPWAHYVFLFLIPNGVWIVFPAYFVFSYGSQLLAILSSHKEKKN